MKKFRIAVQLPIEIYLEVEAEDAGEAYGKVYEISPIKQSATFYKHKRRVEINTKAYEDEGHKVLGTNLSEGRGIMVSKPNQLRPMWHTYEVKRNESRYMVPDKNGCFPRWVSYYEYPPSHFHEILVKVPALIRVFNLYHEMDQKDPTSEKKIDLWKCLRKVLSVQMIEDMQNNWYNPHLGFESFDRMHGVGDKTREKIKKFSDELEGTEEFERLMKLGDKGEEQ